MDSKLQQIQATLNAADETDVTRLDESHIRKIRLSFPNVPNDYLDLLKTIGWGNYGFVVYSGPVHPDEIFGVDGATDIRHFLIIGDNMAGWMFAYDTTQTPWRMVLLNHNVPVHTGNSPADFTSFVLAELIRE
ncbi:hypothetical protein LOC67_08290 [Stieleria sp. JC731]|uniref:hypothetical protein n=1 Tax=Pirellulaceae TaxID=2691357 RepID=UPI001E6212CD|nr:hypothetical protein [Stieleria sp. JC731]MCC9600557.1 hypothetical protein [Stieleria sp. JC731]